MGLSHGRPAACTAYPVKRHCVTSITSAASPGAPTETNSMSQMSHLTKGSLGRILLSLSRRLLASGA
jgi:hypothetical protein